VVLVKSPFSFKAKEKAERKAESKAEEGQSPALGQRQRKPREAKGKPKEAKRKAKPPLLLKSQRKKREPKNPRIGPKTRAAAHSGPQCNNSVKKVSFSFHALVIGR
jgi:hypothetical protein